MCSTKHHETEIQWKSFNPKLLFLNYRLHRISLPVPPNAFFVSIKSIPANPKKFGRFLSIFRLSRSDLGSKTYIISRKKLKHTSNNIFSAFKSVFPSSLVLNENQNRKFHNERTFYHFRSQTSVYSSLWLKDVAAICNVATVLLCHASVLCIFSAKSNQIHLILLRL